jgi:poly-gamma-glutamate capsule biosynthesis protein CapA/YwtB (metallophosphatase superfamily)
MMLYEEESSDISVALTGDALVSRRLTPYREPRYLSMVERLRNADVSITNCETLFHRHEGAPTWDAGPGGTYVATDPRIIEDLKWMGFDIVAAANNHALDFGEAGLLANMRNLEAHGLPYAGMGRSLTEAVAPTYLDTPKGRVALLSVTCSLPAAGHRPGDSRGREKPRPGVNVLRHEVVYTVPRSEFGALLSMTSGLGLNYRPMGSGEPRTDGTAEETTFLGKKFVAGDGYSVATCANQHELELNLRWVRDARRMADWVIVSVHNHERGATADEPADFVKTFARACIDAGADIFHGHGPHQDRGIEVYKGKPIVYALGDFILQNDVFETQPWDLFERYGLDSKATPADLYDYRSGNETRGQVVQPIRWQSAVVVADFAGGRLRQLRLLPLDLGFSTHRRSQRGRPVLAEGEVAEEIISRFRQLSEPFGTCVEMDDGQGVVRVD